MKKQILLISILCVLTYSVWGQNCLSEESRKVGYMSGFTRPMELAAYMMLYEGRLNGDFLGILSEFKRKADAGDFDKMGNPDLSLKKKFMQALSPDASYIMDKEAHFNRYFGSKWGPVALNLHAKKGDIEELRENASSNNRLYHTVDTDGCLK